MGDPSRREIEEMWRERLRAAGKRYYDAAAEYQRIEAEHRARTVPSADSNYAFTQALRNESHARAEYVRVLQTFTRLILHGEPPGEEERSA